MDTDTGDAMSIAQLQEALVSATTDGAWGQGMHPSKKVYIRVDDWLTDRTLEVQLEEVRASFINGTFCLVLVGGDPIGRI